LREIHRLRVFENRVFRIFRPKRDEVTREWRKLHNEELNVLYSSPNIVQVIKRPRGRPRLRWEDGVEEDVAKLGCKNWKIVTLNREGWKKLLKEVEAHPGL
jgi:hypothetical protein